VAFNALGSLAIVDQGNHRIKEVQLPGQISVDPGVLNTSALTGTGSLAFPTALLTTKSGDLWAADLNALVRIDSKGVVSKIAGADREGLIDGAGSRAQFNRPSAMVELVDGTILVADSGNNALRLVDALGNVKTYAGTGRAGFANGSAPMAEFSSPVALAFDASGDLLVADQGGNQLRRVTPWGTTSSTASGFQRLSGLAIDAQRRVWLSDSLGQSLKVWVPSEAPAVPFASETNTLAMATTVPTRTMAIDGRLEQWAGLSPVLWGSSLSSWLRIPGSTASALYLAQDSRYLYVLYVLADGSARSGDSLHYGMGIDFGGGEGIWSEISGWDMRFQPWMSLYRGKGPLWNDPPPTDCLVANGVAQARFPIALFKKYLVPGMTYHINARVNRNGPAVKYQEGPSVGNGTWITFF
jgi:hypothetical protein